MTDASSLTVLYLDIGTDWRGGQRQILWMGEGLRARGGRPIFALRPGAPLGARARASGIEVVDIDPLIAEWGPWTVLRLRRLVHREGVRILHPQSGHTMALAALAALGTRVPIVFARRVDTPLNAGRATRLKYARARRIISVSRAAVAGLVEAGVDPSRVDVIPSGIPLGRCITPASRELLAGLGVPPDVPLAVQVSALVRHKNPLGFVHAIAAARRRVPALHALLVGEGPLREEAAREVRALGLENAVHLTGFRTDPEALTAAADVVVLSSVAQEGTPGVLMDAMALGRPVAAMAAGGVPEVVEQGVSGIVVPIGDSEALGDAIAEIVSDPARAARMGAAGVERAKCFDIQRTVDRTIEVYRSLLAESER